MPVLALTSGVCLNAATVAVFSELFEPLFQEKEISALEQRFAEMKRTADSMKDDESSGDMVLLAEKNSRLKFRMGHLQNVRSPFVIPDIEQF